MNNIILIIIIFILLFSFYLLSDIKNRINKKNYEYIQYLITVKDLSDKEERIKQNLFYLEQKVQSAESLVRAAEARHAQLQEEQQNKFYSSFEKLQQQYEIKIKKLNMDYDEKRKIYQKAETEYKQNFLNLMEDLSLDFQNKILYNNNIIEKKQDECKVVQTELDTLKKSYDSRMEVLRRENEESCKRNFYQIQLKDSVLADISKINNFKDTLKDESILNKLLWKTYIEKPTSELLTRLFDTKSPCGIYKITNSLNEKSYIGQSVNVRDRIKTHIKCGIGAEVATANKLYTEMKKHGVWNFTFELLEECPRSELNAREAYWIKFYDSFNYGLNATQGNKA